MTDQSRPVFDLLGHSAEKFGGGGYSPRLRFSSPP